MTTLCREQFFGNQQCQDDTNEDAEIAEFKIAK